MGTFDRWGMSSSTHFHVPMSPIHFPSLNVCSMFVRGPIGV
jgi:hypothetical protein